VAAVRITLCLLASVPAAWFVTVLRERVPDRQPLFTPVVVPALSRPYITIHAVVSLLFTAAAIRLADTPALTFVGFLVFITAAVALSAIDLDVSRLPDAIVGGALIVSVPLITLASVLEGNAERIRYAIGGSAFYFVFLLVAHYVHPRGMGFGDVKLAALLGLYVGWLAPSGLTVVVLVLYAMLAGFVVGSLAGMVLLAVRGRSHHYPFGPFLIGGAMVVMAFSAQLLPAGV
jgi:leader peptidase (prepilin peptidase) / N-methyltransferase